MKQFSFKKSAIYLLENLKIHLIKQLNKLGTLFKETVFVTDKVYSIDKLITLQIVYTCLCILILPKFLDLQTNVFLNISTINYLGFFDLITFLSFLFRIISE